MNIQRYILLILVLALWIGCEEPVNLIIPDQQQLIVMSNFSDNDTLEVVVSQTVPATSQEFGSYISNAIVEVYEEDKVIDRLEYVPSDNAQFPSFYRSRFFVPQRGVNYMIKVEAEGFDPVMAFNFIPEHTVGIDTNSVVFEAKETPQGLFNTRVDFEVSISIDDPIDQENFYHLNFYQEAFWFQVNPIQGDTIKTSFYSLPLEIKSLNEVIPMIAYIDDRGVLFKDNTFNGQKITLEFEGSFIYENRSQLLGDFLIELRSTSEAYYDYHTSLARQVQSGSDPLSDPVILDSNIENGHGIFAGFAAEFYLLDLTLSP